MATGNEHVSELVRRRGSPDRVHDLQPSTPVTETVKTMREDMNRLRGRLFELVEAVGLNERQERALKGCIRTTTYDAQANLESALRGT